MEVGAQCDQIDKVFFKGKGLPRVLSILTLNFFWKVLEYLYLEFFFKVLDLSGWPEVAS